MANSLTKIKTNAIDDDAVTLAKQAAGTDGQIITYDASGNPTAVGPGTDGQVLTSTGAGSPPAFEDAASSGAALTGSTNNTITTVTGANAIQGEANLTYDGTTLTAVGSTTAANNTNTDPNIIAGSQTLIRQKGNHAGIGGDTYPSQIISGTGGGDLELYTINSGKDVIVGTQATERARVNSDGQLLLGSTANYGTIGTAAAFQIQGTNTGGNVSMNIVNAATSNASSTCDINAWQDYRLSTRIISGRENANNWTSASSQAASYLAFYTNNAGTVAEKARIRSAGGITFNGDTANANALDDYEQGSFTPTLRKSGDTTGQVDGTGAYTKIGNVVHAKICFANKACSNIPDGAVAEIVGLPFNAHHGTHTDEMAISGPMVEMGIAQRNGGIFRTTTATSYLRAYYMQNNSTWAVWYVDDFNNSGVYLIFGITYLTT